MAKLEEVKDLLKELENKQEATDYAIKIYKEALESDPTIMAALSGGESFNRIGALEFDKKTMLRMIREEILRRLDDYEKLLNYLAVEKSIFLESEFQDVRESLWRLGDEQVQF